jgi:hypothetical protein
MLSIYCAYHNTKHTISFHSLTNAVVTTGFVINELLVNLKIKAPLD